METINGSTLEHVQLARGRFLGRLFHSQTPSLHMDYGNYNLPVLAKGPTSPAGVTIGFLAQSHDESTFDCESAPEGTVAIWGEGMEMHTTLSANCEWFTLQIKRDQLEAAGIDLPDDVRAHHSLGRSAYSRLRHEIGGTLRELDKIRAGFVSASHLDLIMDELADTMTSSVGHIVEMQNFSRRSAAAARSRHERLILKRAEDYMDAYLAEPVTITGICSEIACPIYRLERIFNKSLGVTPKQFLMLKRLTKLRSMLLKQSSQDISVASASISCGLTHLGRSAAAYHRLYSETPSETLRARS